MKKLLLLFLLGCQSGTFAQVRSLADSLQFIRSGFASGATGVRADRNTSAFSSVLYTSPVQANRLHQVLSNATQLAADSIPKAGILQTSYRYTTGGLHYSQQPYLQHEADLNTEGLSSLGRTRIAGSFRAGRIWQDSMANYLGGYFDGIAPYYYFATKAGKYQGQRYQMQMVLSYRLYKDRLYAGLGADYDYRWTTRSVDPRPEDKNMEFNVHPSVSLRLRKTLIGIEFTTGYQRGWISIDYQNRTFNVSTLYPDRFYYMNMGYGNIALRYGVITRRTAGNTGIGLHFAGGYDSWQVKADISYKRENEVNHKALDTAYKSTFFSRWETDHYKADFLFTKDGANSVQQVLMKARLQSGSDFNSLYNGVNYFAARNSIAVRYYLLQKNKSSFEPQYGLFAGYSEGYNKDVLAAHYSNYKTLQPGLILGGQYYFKSNGDRLNIRLEPSLVLPLDAKWQVPSTQENVFTRAVVYPDFYYHSTRLFSAQLYMQYISKRLLKTLVSGFSLETQWLQAAGTGNFQPPPYPNQQGVSRFTIELGFHVFL